MSARRKLYYEKKKILSATEKTFSESVSNSDSDEVGNEVKTQIKKLKFHTSVKQTSTYSLITDDRNVLARDDSSGNFDGTARNFVDKQSIETFEDFFGKYEEVDVSDRLSYDTDDCEDLSRNVSLSIHDWYVRNPNVPKSSASDLLRSLQCFFPSLPSSIESLVRPNPCNEMSLITNTDDNGEYVFFGVHASINSRLQVLDSNKLHSITDVGILMVINVDGIQLFKSTDKTLWTICIQIPCLDKTPILCGAYYGTGKPNHETFLKPLVDELEDVTISKSIKLANGTVPLSKVLFVCDAPARSFLKKIKSHTGYSSCERCITEGTYTQGRVVFDEFECAARTDTTFRDQRDECHHIGTSLLQNLRIDMVSDVLLDSMHLISLGVMRRLLMWWLASGPLSCRIPGRTQSKINQLLCSYQPYFSRCFSRKPLPLSEIKRSKATQLRSFLLYSGVNLKSFLTESVYKNFLLLHCAYTILSSRRLYQRFSRNAESCLKEFVRHSKEIYGSLFLSYNVHNLLHISDDVRNHALPADFLSAFCFENYFVHLKKAIKSPYRPLKQLTNQHRCNFFNQFHREKKMQFIRKFNANPPYLSQNYSSTDCFHTLKINDFFLSSYIADCMFLSNDKNIYKTMCIVREGLCDSPVICCRQLNKLHVSSLYEYPYDSKLFDIYKCGIDVSDDKNFSKEVFYLYLSDIDCKFLCLPLDFEEWSLFALDVPVSNDCAHCTIRM